MLAHTVRSGLTESLHRGSAIAVDTEGNVLLEHGNPDRPIFYRSAIKPFQALVSVRVGVPLSPEEMAVTCASHSGFPIHIALVRKILDDAGLTEDALQTPADWPIAPAALDALRAAGHRSPRRIWHNCSGKHAGFLATCRRAGWDTATYRDPDHPLQREIVQIVEETTEMTATPVGVDGCGAPALRGTVRGLATAFAKLSVEPRFAATAIPVHRFPGLVGGDRDDTQLGAWWDGPMKGGAQGLLGGGRNGVGIAVRSESGSGQIAVVGFIEVARRLGLLSEAAQQALAEVATPAVLGHGKPVGVIQPVMSS